MTSKREELRDCHHCLYEPIDATHKPCSECYNNEHWHCGTPRREDRDEALAENAADRKKDDRRMEGEE